MVFMKVCPVLRKVADRQPGQTLEKLELVPQLGWEHVDLSGADCGAIAMILNKGWLQSHELRFHKTNVADAGNQLFDNLQPEAAARLNVIRITRNTANHVLYPFRFISSLTSQLLK